MSLHNMHATVGEFLETIGLFNIPWQGEGLTLELEQDKHMYLEFSDQGILFSMGQSIYASELEARVMLGLKAVDYKKGLPLSVQVGVVGERELLFTLFYTPSQVTISSLSEGLDVLFSLHSNLNNGLYEKI